MASWHRETNSHKTSWIYKSTSNPTLTQQLHTFSEMGSPCSPIQGRETFLISQRSLVINAAPQIVAPDHQNHRKQ